MGKKSNKDTTKDSRQEADLCNETESFFDETRSVRLLVVHNTEENKLVELSDDEGIDGGDSLSAVPQEAAAPATSEADSIKILADNLKNPAATKEEIDGVVAAYRLAVNAPEDSGSYTRVYFSDLEYQDPDTLSWLTKGTQLEHQDQPVLWLRNGNQLFGGQEIQGKPVRPGYVYYLGLRLRGLLKKNNCSVGPGIVISRGDHIAIMDIQAMSNTFGALVSIDDTSKYAALYQLSPKTIRNLLPYITPEGNNNAVQPSGLQTKLLQINSDNQLFDVGLPNLQRKVAQQAKSAVPQEAAVPASFEEVDLVRKLANDLSDATVTKERIEELVADYRSAVHAPEDSGPYARVYFSDLKYQDQPILWLRKGNQLFGGHRNIQGEQVFGNHAYRLRNILTKNNPSLVSGIVVSKGDHISITDIQAVGDTFGVLVSIDDTSKYAALYRLSPKTIRNLLPYIAPEGNNNAVQPSELQTKLLQINSDNQLIDMDLPELLKRSAHQAQQWEQRQKAAQQEQQRKQQHQHQHQHQHQEHHHQLSLQVQQAQQAQHQQAQERQAMKSFSEAVVGSQQVSAQQLGVLQQPQPQKQVAQLAVPMVQAQPPVAPASPSAPGKFYNNDIGGALKVALAAQQQRPSPQQQQLMGQRQMTGQELQQVVHQKRLAHDKAQQQHHQQLLAYHKAQQQQLMGQRQMTAQQLQPKAAQPAVSMTQPQPPAAPASTSEPRGFHNNGLARALKKHIVEALYFVIVRSLGGLVAENQYGFSSHSVDPFELSSVQKLHAKLTFGDLKKLSRFMEDLWGSDNLETLQQDYFKDSPFPDSQIKQLRFLLEGDFSNPGDLNQEEFDCLTVLAKGIHRELDATIVPKEIKGLLETIKFDLDRNYQEKKVEAEHQRQQQRKRKATLFQASSQLPSSSAEKPPEKRQKTTPEPESKVLGS